MVVEGKWSVKTKRRNKTRPRRAGNATPAFPTPSTSVRRSVSILLNKNCSFVLFYCILSFVFLQFSLFICSYVFMFGGIDEQGFAWTPTPSRSSVSAYFILSSISLWHSLKGVRETKNAFQTPSFVSKQDMSLRQNRTVSMNSPQATEDTWIDSLLPKNSRFRRQKRNDNRWCTKRA